MLIDLIPVENSTGGHHCSVHFTSEKTGTVVKIASSVMPEPPL